MQRIMELCIAPEMSIIVHLEEQTAGQGALDYGRLLSRTALLPSWTSVVVEDLTDYGQVTEARKSLVESAETTGVYFK